MNEQSILNKIKSNFILEKVFSYVKEDNFEYKLFIHSKFFQKKLQLNYQVFLFLKEIDYNFDNYIYDLINKSTFNKNILKQKLENDLLKYKLNINNIQKYCINHYVKEFKNIYEENYLNKEKNINIFEKYKEKFLQNEKKISIYSPFFEILSKLKIFEYFYIDIKIYSIQMNNSKNDYISFFNDLNKSNINYSALFFEYKEDKDIDYLKDFNINFTQIKRLVMKSTEKINNYNYFFKNLLLFDLSNLIYLNISLRATSSTNENKIEPDLFEEINKLRLLEELKLYNFSFTDIVILKLYNLKKLKLDNCKNISLDEKTCLHLKNLDLFLCKFDNINSLFKFPELKKLYLYDNRNFNIDSSSLSNLKYLESDTNSFLNLDNTILIEELILKNNSNSGETEKKIIQKIFLMKSLKYIAFEFDKIKINEICQLKGENNSVNSLTIFWKNINGSLLYKFFKLFPNISKLKIYTSNEGSEGKLDIMESSNCKVTEFSLVSKNIPELKFNCAPYEDLVKVDFDFSEEIIKIKESFPIFNDKCKVIFKSLTHFSLHSLEIGLDILNNIYNNIDKLPNLKYFKLNCINIEIDKEFHDKFIIKLLGLKLDFIHFEIRKEIVGKHIQGFYTKDELQKIYANLESYNSNKIKIRKFQKIYKIYPKRKKEK